MNSKKEIKVDHNVDMYRADNPYQKENDLMGRKYVQYLLEYSGKCQDFLELGIGFGSTIDLLSRHFSNLLVLDAEQRLIDRYRYSYPNVEFRHTYFEFFETDRLFRGIGMGFVLDLVSDPAQLLQKYANLLEEDGKIYVANENASSLHRRIAHAAGILPDMKSMSDHNRAYGHRFYLKHEEWLDVFQRAGLRVCDSHGLYLKPFSTGQIESLRLVRPVYEAMADVARDFPEISNASFFVLQK